MEMPATRLLYDRKSAAQQLSISVRSLDYLIQQQRIATRRIGKKVMVQHTELARFSRGNHTQPVRGNVDNRPSHPSDVHGTLHQGGPDAA
ncbi:MAG: hypothetical protein ABR924_19075 [Terracidiphilus sp.]|jgi:hypothetical protein